MEAFLDYHDHLTETGVLFITRPFSGLRIQVSLRMMDLARAALTAQGVAEPARHVLMLGYRARLGWSAAARPDFERMNARVASDILLRLCLWVAAIALVLGIFLLLSGVGSLLSRRAGRPGRLAVRASPAVIAGILVHAFARCSST